MNPIKAIDENGKEQEVDLDSAKYFGTEVKKTYYKNNKFKSFENFTWIKITAFRLYIKNWKISDLKKYFENYESDKRVITEEKEGKTKKATEWSCSVIDKNKLRLNDEEVKIFKIAVQKRRLVRTKGKVFYHIFKNFFRDNTETDRYFYLDEENKKLIDTGFHVMDGIKQKHLEEWENG